MSEFRNADWSGLTVEVCDRLALESAGRVWSYGYGFTCPRACAAINAEYGSTVINTQGMGNHGTIVLRGRTPRARALLREGKVRLLLKEGVDRRVAEAAVLSTYGMELPVVTLAERLLDVVARDIHSWAGYSHAQFEAWSGITDHGCSFGRVCAAVAIAEQAVWGSPPRSPRGVSTAR